MIAPSVHEIIERQRRYLEEIDPLIRAIARIESTQPMTFVVGDGGLLQPLPRHGWSEEAKASVAQLESLIESTRRRYGLLPDAPHVTPASPDKDSS